MRSPDPTATVAGNAGPDVSRTAPCDDGAQKIKALRATGEVHDLGLAGCNRNPSLPNTVTTRCRASSARALVAHNTTR
jgi:hypothetical protein